MSFSEEIMLNGSNLTGYSTNKFNGSPMVGITCCMLVQQRRNSSKIAQNKTGYEKVYILLANANAMMNIILSVTCYF